MRKSDTWFMNVIVAITKHALYACFYSVVEQILTASKDVGKKNGCAKDVGKEWYPVIY